MDVELRRRLRAALRERYPWVDDASWGPAAVESGECDECGIEARLVQGCGPGAARYLGRGCAERRGADAWCVGHANEAGAALRWLATLPDEADAVARLWWVATGEVTLDPDLVRPRAAQLGVGLG
jgi:hypothetical protein